MRETMEFENEVRVRGMRMIVRIEYENEVRVLSWRMRKSTMGIVLTTFTTHLPFH